MITVKGVEVRADEVNVETEFQFLTAEGQRRVFLENKEKFLKETFNSIYPAVRRIFWEPEVLQSCSSYLLNRLVIMCCIRNLAIDDILDILNVPGFEVEEATRDVLIYSNYWRLQLWVAKNERTPLDVLKTREMFFRAAQSLVYDNSSEIFDAIVSNPNFEVDKEIEETIQGFLPEGAEKIRARIAELKK